MSKGHCKHGEFELNEGCHQCTADRIGKEGNTEASIAEAIAKSKEVLAGDASAVEGLLKAVDLPSCIVKVKYSEGSRAYTYYSVDQLQVGDVVWVPVKGTTAKGTVIEIDVPASEVEAFKDKVKTIPAGAKIEPKVESSQAEELVDTKINLCDTCKSRNDYPVCSPRNVECGDGKGNDNIIKCSRYQKGAAEPCTVPLNVELKPEEAPAPETALALRPGEDIEARGYFKESMELLEFAESRSIVNLEGLTLATDDLALIAKLKKLMENKRKSLLEPLKLQSNAIRETYEYLMQPVLQADRLTKDKMLSYRQEQERIRQEQEDINRKRMEAAQQEMNLKGELSEPVNLVEVSPQATKSTTTVMGSAGQTDHWVYEVTDILAVPREYLVIDSAMLGAIAKKHHDNKQIPGIKFYNKPFISVRAK